MCAMRDIMSPIDMTTVNLAQELSPSTLRSRKSLTPALSSRKTLGSSEDEDDTRDELLGYKIQKEKGGDKSIEVNLKHHTDHSTNNSNFTENPLHQNIEESQYTVHINQLEESKLHHSFNSESSPLKERRNNKKSLEKELEDLKIAVERLYRQHDEEEKGRKFDTSWARVLSIMIITFLSLMSYMTLIGVKDPPRSAVVPTLGFYMSTWSMSFMRRLWIRFYDWNWGFRDRERSSLVGEFLSKMRSQQKNIKKQSSKPYIV